MVSQIVIKHYGLLLRAACCLCVLSASARAGQDYDPHAHARNAAIVMAAWSGAVALGGAALLTRPDSLSRGIGRQVVIWGAIDAALAGAAIFINEQDRGMAVPQKTEQLREGIRIDALVDFVLIAVGVVLIQHSRRQRNRIRGWRWVTRGSVHLAYDVANYALTYR